MKSILCALLLIGIALAIPTPHSHYANRAILSDDESPLFELRWTEEPKHLRVAIIAETQEWVSLAFTKDDGSLEGSDGIMARIGENGAEVLDYFVPTDNSCPETICADNVLGCKNHARDIRGKRSGKYIVVEYSRALNALDKCDQPVPIGEDETVFVRWSAGAREALALNMHTSLFSFSSSSSNKRSTTVEMIVLAGRPLNMTLGTWFGHYTLEYWKNVDSSTVSLNYDYNRQTFCSGNPSAVQVAGAELVTLDGYSLYVPKTKRSLRGTTIDWKVEDVQISAGYCTTPTTSTVQCSQYNPAWPECGTDFIPLTISTTSLADTWSQVCGVTATYDFIEQCTPNACWSVPVSHWTNSKYPDAAATTAAGWDAIRDAFDSVEGQTNSNTFTRHHVRSVFNMEISDLTPGDRVYPGNVYPVNVTDIWCGNKPWRTGIDPVPALKPCGTVKVASAQVTTSESVSPNQMSSALSSFANVDESTVQPYVPTTKQFLQNNTLVVSVLDYEMRSGRSVLDLLKLALDYNSTILQGFGIPGTIQMGDIYYEEVKVDEETLDGAASALGASVILFTLLALLLL